MISLDLARKLKQAGLKWQPAQHDFFAVPERGLDDRVFIITDMFANLERILGAPVVAFQGASEWALDYLVTSEAVWMPSEEQLRSLLLDRLEGQEQPSVRLECSKTGCRCEMDHNGETFTFEGAQAGEAYALALLHLLPGQPEEETGGEGESADEFWNRNLPA